VSAAGTDAYKAAGVDNDAGNRAVELLADEVASTRTAEVLGDVGAFGGLYDASALGLDAVLVASTDGVGTKVELAARHGRWSGVGADLVNHSVGRVLDLFGLDAGILKRWEGPDARSAMPLKA